MAKVLVIVDRAIFIRLIHKAIHFHVLLIAAQLSINNSLSIAGSRDLVVD